MYSTKLDGGWGWMVVAGAFVAQMLSDGISYGFGILYVDLMETFRGSSAEISSIGSLSYGSFCFIGPVAGALTNRFGYRFVTILGACLEALGVFLSAFTPNLRFLYFSVGILIGVGGGMMYIASFVCVSVYFMSKRPLATSFSSCGSSAGTFFFGFLYRISIDHYGWRGALFIFSGLMLNGVVCGALFRPFSVRSCTEKVVISSDYDTETDCLLKKNEHIKDNDCQFLATVTDLAMSRQTISKLSHSDTCTSNFSELSDASQSDYSDYDNISNDCEFTEGSEKIPNDFKFHSSFGERKAPTLDHIHVKYILDKDIAVDGICDVRVTASLGHTHRKILDECTSNSSSATNLSNVSTQDLSNEIRRRSKIGSIVGVVLGTTNLHLFKNWKFVLFGISTFLYCFGYGIPFVLLPDMAEINGFTPNEAAWIISECGIAAIVAKFVFGALSQVFTSRDGHANTKLNSYSVILSGIAIACAPWAYSYSILLVIGGTFGFLSAAVNTLVTLVLIEMLGEDRLADAFGWLNFFGGVGYISGPAVAGWLFDVTGAYVATFITAGVSLVLSGIVLFPIIITNGYDTHYEVKTDI